MTSEQQIKQQLAVLKQQHRELDLVIQDLTAQFNSNQIELKRLKKQKLYLKDAITRIESQLIPDLHA